MSPKIFIKFESLIQDSLIKHANNKPNLMSERTRLLGKSLPAALIILLLALGMTSPVQASEDLLMRPEGNSFIDSVYFSVESIALNTLHPAYLKIRADSILSTIFFVIAFLVVFNFLVFNICGLLTCGLCKVLCCSTSEED